MAVKNYYVVLGVPRTESSSGIRAAFRELAKRYHPDRAGAGAEGRFKEIAEAYETLSDPQRRRIYNHTLGEADRVATPVDDRLESSAVWPEPEPLGREMRSLFRDCRSIGPSFAEVYERFARNFTGRGIPRSSWLLAVQHGM